jgi:hypothetical protein
MSALQRRKMQGCIIVTNAALWFKGAPAAACSPWAQFV